LAIGPGRKKAAVVIGTVGRSWPLAARIRTEIKIISPVRMEKTTRGEISEVKVELKII